MGARQSGNAAEAAFAGMSDEKKDSRYYRAIVTKISKSKDSSHDDRMPDLRLSNYIEALERNLFEESPQIIHDNDSDDNDSIDDDLDLTALDTEEGAPTSKQPTIQPAMQPIGQPASQPIDQPVSQPIDQSNRLQDSKVQKSPALDEKQIETICELILSNPDKSEEYCKMIKDCPVEIVNRIIDKWCVVKFQNTRAFPGSISRAYDRLCKYMPIEINLQSAVFLFTIILCWSKRMIAGDQKKTDELLLDTIRRTRFKYNRTDILNQAKNVILEHTNRLFNECYNGWYKKNPYSYPVYVRYRTEYNNIRNIFCPDLPPFEVSEIYKAMFSDIYEVYVSVFVADEKDDPINIQGNTFRFFDCKELGRDFLTKIVAADDDSDLYKNIRLKVYKKFGKHYINAIVEGEKPHIKQYIIDQLLLNPPDTSGL